MYRKKEKNLTTKFEEKMARAMYLDVNYLQQEVYCVITILIIRSLGGKSPE